MRCAAPLALLLASACGGLGEPGPQADLARTENAVVSGSPAPDDAAVVALVARRTRCAGETPALLCTGTLVASDVVLTAAHCLEVFGVDGQYEIFIGERLLSPTSGRFLRVSEARAHPAYVRGAHDWDVALLRLASPAGVVPVPLPTPDELPTPGLTLRALGYGDTRDAAEPAGVRRQGTLEVASMDAATFRAIPAPSMSCTGDSGGPVLGSPQGREVLLGVTVSGDFACRSEAVQVRVDAVLEDFVRPFVSGTAPAASVPLSAAQLCAESCDTSAQCPAGLACVEDPVGVRRCMLLALREGDFTGACTDDAACGAGGTCARLESEGEEACRCFTPCAAPREAEGCAAAGSAPVHPAGLLLAALLLRRSRGSGGKRGEATARTGRTRTVVLVNSTVALSQAKGPISRASGQPRPQAGRAASRSAVQASPPNPFNVPNRCTCSNSAGSNFSTAAMSRESSAPTMPCCDAAGCCSCVARGGTERAAS